LALGASSIATARITSAPTTRARYKAVGSMSHRR
jgi:hypothetical protein